MIVHSIRWRLQAWHGIILVAVLVSFGFTAFQMVQNNQWRRIDQELDRQLMTAFRPVPPRRPIDDRLGPPSEAPPRAPGEFRFGSREPMSLLEPPGDGQTNGAYYYILWNKDGSIRQQTGGAPANVPLPANLGPVEPETPRGDEAPGRPPYPPPPPRLQARSRGEFREVFRFTRHGECALVGRSIAADRAAMRRLALWLVTAGSGVLALGLAGGWWMATRAIRPIQEISLTASKISAGDLTQRIDASDTDSELGRLASVLNSTFARLEGAFAAQARFTSDASHELRTPVSVILSQTQTALSRERPPAEYREALEACLRAAQRMRTLIESLLQLARLDAGQEHAEPQSFDLARVASESVALVRPIAAERGVEIKCDLLPNVVCQGSPESFAQVAVNLLSNAVQYNCDHGEVRVSVIADNGTALLIVSDSGVGIAPEDLSNIFKRFYRVDKSRAVSGGHAGLGLAICKAIVETHGGSIEVASQPGAGSTFTVKLPLK